MKTDITNLPASLRSLASRIEAGEFPDYDTCILVLTSEDSKDYDTWFLGEPITYREAIQTLEGLADRLVDDAADDDENTTLN